jgi:hypothetical protein
VSAIDEFDTLAGTAKPANTTSASKPKNSASEPQLVAANDLQRGIDSHQSMLRDMVPGSPSHQRFSSELADMQGAISQMRNGNFSPNDGASSQPQQAPSAQTSPQSSGALAEFDSLASAPATTTSTQPKATTAQPVQNPSTRNVIGPNGQLQSPGFDVVANQVSGLGSTIAGSFRGMYNVGDALVRGKSFDEAVNQGAEAVKKTQDDYTFQPRSEVGQQVVGALGSKWNPLNWIGNAGGYVGDKLAEAGLPGTGALVAGTAAAAPMALGINGVRNGVASVIGDTASMLKPGEKPLAIADRIDPTMTDKSGNPAVIDLRNMANPDYQAKPGTTGGQTMPKPAPATADTPTIDMKPGQTMPKPAQDERSNLLRSVGFNDARQSAIEGNNKSRSVEYQMSKYDEPAGQAAAKQFDNEKQTLSNYTTQMIQDAGGTVGTDQASAYNRGATIVKPIQALRDWFDEKASGLYTAADEKAQGQPVTLGGFGETLADQSQWTNQDRVMLKDAALSYAKKAGMQVGEDGSISGTALQAETVRKYLNSERTHQNGKFVDALKSSLDDDVGKAAGGPIYDQARALWKLRQETINDPKGISSILEEDGTNRKIPLENVAGKVANMPQDQFTHIVKTLQDLPPELKPLGDSALGEIKAHYLNKMLQASTETRGGNGRSFWNGTGVKNVIKDNSGKLSSLMTSDELGKVNTLLRVGDILNFDPSYPGASAQAANAVKRGLMPHMISKGLTAGGALVGGLVGPIGAAGGATLGGMAGERVSGSMAERAALKKWNSQSVSLKQIMSGEKVP